MTQDLPRFDLEHFIPYQFSVIAAQLSADLAALYKDRFGISVAQWRILINLAYSDSQSVRDIQKRVHLDKAKVSRAVSQLEERGLLSKDIDDTDRRLLHLRLTEAGRQMVCELIPLAEAFQTQLATKLAGDLSEMQTHLSHLMKELSDGQTL